MGSWARWRPAELPGRTTEDELTVADLTGLGIQDAAIASLLTRRAGQSGAGQDLPLGGS
jgi:ornithine cyclodeaminase